MRAGETGPTVSTLENHHRQQYIPRCSSLSCREPYHRAGQKLPAMPQPPDEKMSSECDPCCRRQDSPGQAQKIARQLVPSARPRMCRTTNTQRSQPILHGSSWFMTGPASSPLFSVGPAWNSTPPCQFFLSPFQQRQPTSSPQRHQDCLKARVPLPT